ncbi:hypothetical protein ACQ4LE_002103 [Meloidogyne hapla]
MRRFRSLFTSRERHGHISPQSSQEEEVHSTTSTTSNSQNVESFDFFAGDLINKKWSDENWTMNVDFASDPSAWENQFGFTWKKLEGLLSRPKRDKNTILKVNEQLSILCKLLVMEVNSQSEPSIGPILEQFFTESILMLVHNWIVQVSPHYVHSCQVLLLHLYENMVNCCQCPQSLLVHKPILVPLLQLLQWCKQSFNVRHSTKIPKYPNSVVSNCLLQLINQIFRQIAEHETLLHFFFDSSLILNEDWAIIEGNYTSTPIEGILNEQNLHKPFLIFDMLVPYLYGPECTSQIARDALLLIMSASSRNEFIAEHIIHKGDLCHVMSAGLSACFSQLPKCVFTEFCLDSNEAHKLSVCDVKGMPQLYEFHNALLFTNSVAQIAHYSITRQIVHFIYTGFLLKVFKSSIVESEPKEEELCSRIVYFHLCIETISATALLQAFIKILLTTNGEKGEEEEMNLFEQILVKMHESDRLCRVTLSLIRTLLSLHCEDFLWSTIFRHLLPFIQLRHPNQSRRFDANVSLNSANFFLRCIPDCAKNVLELCSEEQFESYLREAGKSIRDCEECCSCWTLKYDGSMPKSLNDPQKLNSEGISITPRQVFTRHSSARSSFASTGWNRYGHSNRSGRGTLLDGEIEPNTNLNSLGEDDELSGRQVDLIERCIDGTEINSQEEFGEASAQYILENEDRPDYFQFIYDRVSESDLDSFSRRNSEEDSQEEYFNNNKSKQKIVTKTQNNSNNSGNSSEKRQSNLSINLIKQQQLSPFMSAVIQTNWNEAKNDRNKFIKLLDSLPTRLSNENKSIEDLSLIDARWQHLEELRIEKLELAQKMSKEPNPFRLNLSGESGEVFLNNNGGILMKSNEEKGAGILLESLFDILSHLTEHSFNTNIQLLGVFNILFSYPQSLLTAYLFYVDSLRGTPLLRLNDILKEIKNQIDFTVKNNKKISEEFEQLLIRVFKNNTNKLLKNLNQHQQNKEILRNLKGKGFFTSTIASLEGTISLNNNEESFVLLKRNLVYSSIVFIQLCQMLAAFALQHSPPAVLMVSRPA